MLRPQLLLAVKAAATAASRQIPQLNSTFSRSTTSIASSSLGIRSPEARRTDDGVELYMEKPFDPSVPPAALTVAPQRPRTHGIPVAMLHLRSHDPDLLDLFIHFVLHASYALNMPVSRAAYLPTKRSLYTVIRGPFAHKKSQENFEKVVHKRAIKVWDTDPQVLGKWIKYLEVNLLGGVGMRIVRWERTTIGFGRAHLNHVEYRRQLDAEAAAENAVKIQEMAESIIRAEMEAAAASDAEAAANAAAGQELEDKNGDPSSSFNSQSSPDSDSLGSSTVAAAAEASSVEETRIKSEEEATPLEGTDLEPNDKS